MTLTHTRPARKRKERSDSAEQAVRAMLGPLSRALGIPDEPSRDAAVWGLLQRHSPGGLDPLIRGLVELLGEEGPVRERAVAYLARLGGAAVLFLSLRFTRQAVVGSHSMRAATE